MRVFDGVPGKDVAAQLGISEPSVTRYLQRVRSLLREQLAVVIQEQLRVLDSLTTEELLRQRATRLRSFGRFKDES